MRLRVTLVAVVVGLVAATWSLLGWGQDPAPASVEGSWSLTVRVTSVPGGLNVPALCSFGRDLNGKGTAICTQTGVSPTTGAFLAETTFHGEWATTADGGFEFVAVGIATQNTTPIGTTSISSRLSLSEDGQSLSGTLVSQTFDNQGNRIVRSESDITGERINVEG